ncbi:hypothetical protein [Bradyrhizobium quebecense]|uniref:Uncharacterized protein n=2 Tax=Bradyrhizobium quebecense TaxID=2748629 RepID=A0ABS3M8R0_9BRAD|nr:hypothetical protein [Bradyrhizobium quebecense]UGY03262.1 hypothetical protein J4P68_0000320 [Bradyrhizobium quebecense]
MTGILHRWSFADNDLPFPRDTHHPTRQSSLTGGLDGLGKITLTEMLAAARHL